VLVDPLHRRETAMSEDQQDCFVRVVTRSPRRVRRQAARAAGSTKLQRRVRSRSTWVLRSPGASQLCSRPLTRPEAGHREDRKSGGTGNERSQETRDGRHRAGVRQMKSGSSRDDAQLREKQVWWQKTSCDVERRSSLALVRPGSMQW